MHKVVTALAIACALTTQQQRDALPQPAGTGRLGGTVVDAESGRPVRFAQVLLMSSSSDHRSAVTDEGGAFSFDRLVRGAYQLRVSKPGYLDTAYGQARPGTDTFGKQVLLQDRQAVANVTISLSHGGSISGVVRDDRGDPVFQATVTVYRWMTSFGVRRLAPVESTQTDERGMYRISRLPPRDYLLGAAPAEFSMPETREGPHPFGFAAIFHPGVATGNAAESIQLGLGEQKSGVDLQLPLVALGRVSGTVVDGSGRPVAGVNVTLLPKDAGSGESGHSVETERDGRFKVESVAPGSYAVTASTIPTQHGFAGAFLNKRMRFDGSLHFEVQPTVQIVEAEKIVTGQTRALAADAPPAAASGDVTVAGGGDVNVMLTLEPPRKVAGRLVFEGPTRPPPLKEVRIEMEAVNGHDGPPGANVNDDGTFELANVVPGRYAVSLDGIDAPWSLASATSGGVDVLDFFLDVPRDRDVRDLTITVRDRRAELTGAVTDSSGRPAPGRTVIVFASDDRLWPAPQRVQAENLFEDGAYAFRDLRPGRYLLAIVDGVEHGEWLDPSFLRRLIPAAVAVTLGDGERKVQDLRVR
jgi:5-hydroxyisourate hydrolase-like protein (transthyretin family)